MLIGKVCKYKLLRTVCNASSLEMNSENKKKQQKTWETTQADAVLNSQILYHRILGFGATSTQNRKPGEGHTGQGNQEKHQHPERRSAGYHSATVVPDSYPNSLSLVRRNSYTITSSLLKTRRVFIDPYSSTFHEAHNTLYCCCCLLMFQVAACIAERVSGAAALFKVIVSSSLDFFDCNVVFIISSVIFTQSLCIFLLVEPIFSSLWQC